MRPQRLLLRVRLVGLAVGRPSHGRLRCLDRRLWVARAVVVFVTGFEIESVVVVAVRTAAVIVRGLAQAAVSEKAQQQERSLAERVGLVCCAAGRSCRAVVLLGLQSAVRRWWQAQVRHLGRPCWRCHFTGDLLRYNGT